MSDLNKTSTIRKAKERAFIICIEVTDMRSQKYLTIEKQTKKPLNADISITRFSARALFRRPNLMSDLNENRGEYTSRPSLVLVGSTFKHFEVFFFLRIFICPKIGNFCRNWFLLHFFSSRKRKRNSLISSREVLGTASRYIHLDFH